MPISVVVGGQFGSEGKGKVAHALALELGATAAIRVGGSNSGHTVIDAAGRAIIFRHLPTAVLEPSIHCVLPAGCYIHEPTLLKEMEISGIHSDKLSINPFAVIITDLETREEIESGLTESIGSTGSGTGRAVVRRAQRMGGTVFAKDVASLIPYLRETTDLLDTFLKRGERILIEGTQGFGLSLLHSNHHPFCTSRDTTAASFVSEAGLSPLDVDQVIMVIRAFPIRVSGNSGILPREFSWEILSQESGSPTSIREYTSVTKKLRRVARFSPDVVKRAISYNKPNVLVINHVDYVDHSCQVTGKLSAPALSFVRAIEDELAKRFDYVGVSPSKLIGRNQTLRQVRNHGK